jgi:hypothetical protein
MIIRMINISRNISTGRVNKERINFQKFPIAASVGETTLKVRVLLLGDVAPCE